MKKIKVSNNVIRRLPRYLRQLDELMENGLVRISSAELGRLMGITPSQIRQDLSTFGEFGLQGYGYSIAELRDEILHILGGNNGYSAVLVGAGKIGRALMSNFSFESCGVKLECAFDVREELIGQTLDGVAVYDLKDLPVYLQERPVDIAVLTVPKNVAQSTANMLEHSGVEAIWNFTNVEIISPGQDVLVENIHFSDSLFALSYYLTEHRQEKSAMERRHAG